MPFISFVEVIVWVILKWFETEMSLVYSVIYLSVNIPS